MFIDLGVAGIACTTGCLTRGISTLLETVPDTDIFEPVFFDFLIFQEPERHIVRVIDFSER